MVPKLQPRLLAVFGGLALSLVAGSPARALARGTTPTDPTRATTSAPVADDDDEEREMGPGERIVDGIVKRLERLVERAREQGNEEMAERLERRVQEFRKRADGMRRMLRGERDGGDEKRGRRARRRGHRDGERGDRKRSRRPRGPRPGPDWHPALPDDPHHHRLQPNRPKRGDEKHGRRRRRDDQHPRFKKRRFEEHRFEFREERRDGRHKRRRAPEGRRRDRRDDGVELFFGLRMSGRRIELGISPGTRQLRIRIDGDGNERELRFRLGDNPLDSLRELRRGLRSRDRRAPEGRNRRKRHHHRNRDRDRNHRGHNQRTSLL